MDIAVVEECRGILRRGPMVRVRGFVDEDGPCCVDRPFILVPIPCLRRSF